MDRPEDPSTLKTPTLDYFVPNKKSVTNFHNLEVRFSYIR
jgi:hypothetical protein